MTLNRHEAGSSALRVRNPPSETNTTVPWQAVRHPDYTIGLTSVKRLRMRLIDGPAGHSYNESPSRTGVSLHRLADIKETRRTAVA
jgi:hypothetical protein